MALKIKGLRWRMIGRLTQGTVMSDLARGSLAIAAPTEMKGPRISTQPYGWISGAVTSRLGTGARDRRRSRWRCAASFVVATHRRVHCDLLMNKE